MSSAHVECWFLHFPWSEDSLSSSWLLMHRLPCTVSVAGAQRSFPRVVNINHWTTRSCCLGNCPQESPGSCILLTFFLIPLLILLPPNWWCFSSWLAVHLLPSSRQPELRRDGQDQGQRTAIAGGHLWLDCSFLWLFISQPQRSKAGCPWSLYYGIFSSSAFIFFSSPFILGKEG